MYCIMIDFGGVQKKDIKIFENKIYECEDEDFRIVCFINIKKLKDQMFYTRKPQIFYFQRFVFFNTLEQAENYLYLQ